MRSLPEADSPGRLLQAPCPAENDLPRLSRPNGGPGPRSAMRHQLGAVDQQYDAFVVDWYLPPAPAGVAEASGVTPGL